MIACPNSPNLQLGNLGPLRTVPSEYDRRLRVLDLTVELLIARTSLEDFWEVGFQDVGKLLVTVKFPVTGRMCANRRLQNGLSYCQQREFGAAAFELRVLRGQLQSL
jgi:hypothetical protein